MKKLSLLLLLAFVSVSAISQHQQIKIINFTIKGTLPETVDRWQTYPDALVMTAQKVRGANLKGAKLSVIIKSGSTIICRNTISTVKLLDPFDTRTFNTAALTNSLINCGELKEGAYTICVQFFNIDKTAISEEVCKLFKVETRNPENDSPTLITPENGKSFSLEELLQPVQFSWNPQVSKTPDPVNYRLRVWQKMEKQDGTPAIRNNLLIADKTVTDITHTSLSNLVIAPCEPPYKYDFVWTVTATGGNGKPIGKNNGISDMWSFFAHSTNTIKPPVNVYPENNKSIGIDAAKNPFTFKWKPVEPKQPTPVTYKLRLWQLKQGQSGISAIKENQPLVLKEVTEGNEVTLQDLNIEPCLPPNSCNFIWNVEASVKNVKGVPQEIGTSQSTTFLMTQYIIQLDSINVKCTVQPGVYSFSFSFTNVNPGTAIMTNMVVTSSVPGGASLSSFLPPLGTLINSGNQLTVTGTINGPVNLSNICIGAQITDVGNSFWQAAKDTCIIVNPCTCEACDEDHFTMNAPAPSQITWNNNTWTFNQPISIITSPPKTIKTIKADIVYFEMIPQLANCLPCNKDAVEYGHFPNGTNSQLWNGPQTSLNINITTPEVPCCTTNFRWCIRYRVEFTDCTVCTKLICYEKEKAGCVAGKGENLLNKNPK